ncbi:MAG: hypothetical protein FWE45_04930 [Firmicutes bacterium]|nr:hypothetical protein [Bacillota bacterium]
MIKVAGNELISEQFPNKETKLKDFVGGIVIPIEMSYSGDYNELVKLMFTKKHLDDVGIRSSLDIDLGQCNDADNHAGKFIRDLGFENIKNIPQGFEEQISSVPLIDQVQVTQNAPNHSQIDFKYTNDADLVSLFGIKRQMDELGLGADLVIHYMPYSRMDREIGGKDGEPGDLFTLKYMTDFIASLEFDKVTVVEPHSQKTVDLFKENGVNIEDVYPTKEWITQFVEEGRLGENDHIVFPDKGAWERYSDLDLPNVIALSKTRDPQTGQITNMFIDHGQVNEGSNAIIVDDLCSKGGTFAWAGKIMKDAGVNQVDLMVAHTEDSILRGKLLEQDSPITNVYTSRSIFTGDHPNIKILDPMIKNLKEDTYEK